MQSSSGPAPTRIVCLGGGYVALFLCRALRGAIRRGLVDVTVISRDNFHTYHGFVAEMLVGRIQPGQIMSPARRIFAPAHFHNAEIERVDTGAKTVTTSRILDGREQVLPYDHLVLGLGSTDDLARYPGLAEHAHRLRSYWDAFRVRNDIISMLEMAEIETDPAERRRLLTFVIAGGNYGGVEVASELSEYFDLLVRKEYPRLEREEFRIVLVHSGDRILPELGQHHPKLADYGQRITERSGIEVRLRTKLVAATPEEAVTSAGERIPTRTIISCTGTAMSPLLDQLRGAERERPGGGRVCTDACGRVAGAPEVWAGGDCAATPHPKGGSYPPLAIYAMAAGWRIGRNVLRVARGEAPKPARFAGLGDAVSLGRRRAVAHLKGIPFYGLPGWILWRIFLLGFVPTWDRRVRLVVDWVLTPLFGRDVVNMRLQQPVGLGREMYEAGQEVVRQGDIGRRLYLIWKGEVEVVKQEPNGAERLLAVLGPGQHFGETAVFSNVRRTATVRARSRVELVSLGRSEAVALSESSQQFAAAVRRLPGTGAEQAPVAH
ncbi:MAG TPA: FAD-dependent oxidoreductase [Gemmatimonadaceae bacterium]|nr:FAD-dependent oxidoreductase [Gemmatimonadaceae bacterium]